jgi:hypothetical protein
MRLYLRGLALFIFILEAMGGGGVDALFTPDAFMSNILTLPLPLGIPAKTFFPLVLDLCVSEGGLKTDYEKIDYK